MLTAVSMPISAAAWEQKSLFVAQADSQKNGEGPIDMGPAEVPKQEGSICYSGHCKICKTDADGACTDCSDDPLCEKPKDEVDPQEVSPPDD